MNLNLRFFAPNLEDGEKILHVAHRHIFILLGDSFKVIFFGILLPIGFFLLFPTLYTVSLLWGFVGLFGMFYHFVDWYFDVWLITNRGVVDIDRNGFFDITSTRIEYHMIEGTSYAVKGFLQTLFNYGTVTVDKLGANTHVVLRDAVSPKSLERIILKYQERFVQDKSFKDHTALKSMLSEMISYHIQNEKLNLPKE